MDSNRRALAAIGGIGIAQLIAWGSLYYAIAIMSAVLQRGALACLTISAAASLVAYAVAVPNALRRP